MSTIMLMTQFLLSRNNLRCDAIFHTREKSMLHYQTLLRFYTRVLLIAGSCYKIKFYGAHNHDAMEK